MPFIELQDYYAREVTHQVKVLKNYDAEIPEPNLLLMDFDSNAAILVANYLLNDPTKLTIFNNFARIKGLNSFKIVIQLNKVHGNQKVLLPHELARIIDNLNNCATTRKYIPNAKGDYYELDFLVTEATTELFSNYFSSPRELFLALSKLNLLNTLCIQAKYRTGLRKKRKEGKLLRFPIVPAFDKIFRIEDIEMILSKPSVRTEYLKISDGEHQFMHIVGGLLLFDELEPEREVIYLLDEPDTHFNPQWRSEFFRELDVVLSNKNHEIMLTTHSPFILGDCHGYNVFVFERNPETHKLNFSRSQYETFGSNFSYLLQNIFKFKHQLSEKSREHLDKLEAKVQAADNKLQRLSKEEVEKLDLELKLYGESIEKRFLVNEIDKLLAKFDTSE
ncbi:AAA family ATPase [Pedobacter panaciterrae]